MTGLKAQPNFPREDLSDTNAEWLELMLANRQLLEQGHQASENVSWTFRVGHKALAKETVAVYDDDRQTEAINHGIVTFEAINVMVNSDYPFNDISGVNRTAHKLLLLDERDIPRRIDQAVDVFQVQTPRTAEVISRSSQRFYGSLTAYAILGAALSRQFELDCAERVA